METAPFASHYQRGVAGLKVGPDAAYVDRLDGERLYLTPAIEGLAPVARLALLKRAMGALYDSIPAPSETEVRYGGAIAVKVAIVDADGRKLYVDTPCSGSFTMLTEHQRSQAMFVIGNGDDAQDRTQAHPLPKRVALKALRRAFHSVMSWKPAYFINWAPEGGFFEVNLPGRADLARLQRFWPKAPKGFRYDVRANDGTLLTTVRR